MAPVLIDTNILIYLFDQNDIARQDQSIQLLLDLENSGQGRLSVQSLAEFCAASTRKLHPPLTPKDAATQVERFARAFPVFNLTPFIVLEAARGVRTYQLSYFDAQIWASARLNQVPLIFSEDFASGTSLEGVRFVNPFAPDFNLTNWI